MDILIKSFNRPYYLERCLRSVYEHVRGDFEVKVLDDGTPKIYLDKIQRLFPQIHIYRSPNYERKAKAIEQHLRGEKHYQIKEIPADFWCQIVEQSSNIFMLIEDDIWLVKAINVSEVADSMKTNSMVMLKLTWQGNSRMIKGKKKEFGAGIEEIQPEISLYDRIVFLNKYKVRSVLYRLGFFKDLMRYQVGFYVLYSVAAACFEKQYWLSLWRSVDNVVLEETQLRRAYKWFVNHGSTYGKLMHEITQTSYISSTSNGFREIEFDMFLFNHLMNQAWLDDKLDVMQGYPKDFSVDYLKQFLPNWSSGEKLYRDWLVWTERFKNGYRKVGCEVE